MVVPLSPKILLVLQRIIQINHDHVITVVDVAFRCLNMRSNESF